MGIFGKNKEDIKVYRDFSYLDEKVLYFDSACQTLRPQEVLDSMMEYFHKYNSCGGRVKYEWGKKVDSKIDEAKKNILDYLGKSSSEYSVSFTLNATTGLNIVLSQLPPIYKKVITTDIEHNSVFLSTISLSKRLNIPRAIISRNNDGSVDDNYDFGENSILVANNVSNIDGRQFLNLNNVTEKIHKKNGIVIVDAAQGFLYGRDVLKKTDFDALAFSGHKIYGPSIGIVVIKNSLIEKLDRNLLGGGMVQDVSEDDFIPVEGNLSGALLELGLQDYAGIIGLNKALLWNKKRDNNLIKKNAEKIISYLKSEDRVHLINSGEASSVISFYCDNLDSHDLAIYLSEQGVMARSGYFCCHYYLKHVKNYPPLLRISLGQNNSEEQVDQFIKILSLILKNI